jgi:phosphate starvation-inducible PhoH-like protein
MLDPESIPKLISAGTIEVAPLAYMRGRSLNDAFIILDEAQNTTPEQMKMFLTRLGFGSRSSSPATSRRSTCPAAPGPG